jgi:REP element-mobilizing transposase RayT
MDYHQPLLPGEKYHILSRATGNELLFTEPENFRFFLQRFHKYILPVADVFAYALLSNHFHFLVEIKPYDTILELYTKEKKQVTNSREEQNNLSAFVMQPFSNLLNSYTKSFNKKYNRKGALFMDYLRRVQVSSGEQFLATVFYIHKNPVHHGLCKNIADWKWSSYNTILSNAPTNIERQKLIKEFETLQRFVTYHAQPVYLKNAIELE